MATPTTKESQAILKDLFIESIRPIWPNLIKRETPMKYQFINSERRWSLFRNDALTPRTDLQYGERCK